MAKEKFLLVSLKESKAKQLAQIISNDSCRKILDYLAENEATESELAKKLNLPISTVHYNLEHLREGGLVEAEEFHYSEKGKEVYHYKLANKYIIIAPKTTYGIKEKLKTILPVALLVAAGAGFIQLFSKSFISRTGQLSAVETASMEVEQDIAKIAAEEAAPLVATAPEVARGAADMATSTSAIEPSIFSNIALWFLIGAVFAILLYLAISAINKKK